MSIKLKAISLLNHYFLSVFTMMIKSCTVLTPSVCSSQLLNYESCDIKEDILEDAALMASAIAKHCSMYFYCVFYGFS